MNQLERIASLYLTFLNHPEPVSFSRIRRWMPEAYAAEPSERVPTTASTNPPEGSDSGGTGRQQEIESARRKFERDKEFLRNLGMELRHFNPGESLPGGGRAKDHVYMPADEIQRLPEIQLTASQMRLLAAVLLDSLDGRPESQPAPLRQSGVWSNPELAAREAHLLQSAAAKLFYKNPALLGGFAGSRSSQPDEAPTDAATSADPLAIVHEALSKRRVLHIVYADKTGAARSRSVEGRGLISHRGRWCLVAWCREARGIRNFYLDRIRSLETGAERYAPDPNFDIQRYSLHPLALFVESETEVVLELDPEREDGFQDFVSGAPAAVQPRRDSRGRMRLRTTNPGAALGWIIRNPGAVRRLGPESLRRRLLDQLDRMQALHAAENGREQS